MPPKKKGNKKGNDDWEADLGESVDPIAAATQEAKDADAAHDAAEDDVGGGGGLLAALKKNKKQKQKKGKPIQEDYLEGEDPPDADGTIADGQPNNENELAAKAPEEANADDLFDAQPTKAKGGKGKPGKPEAVPKDDEGSDGEGGGLKSKKEKEKEKKEREKQRKKEQVGCS